MSASGRFVRVPTELLEALLQRPLNGTQWRILFWVIRHTFGWNRDRTPFSWYQIARDMTLDRGGVVRAGNRLMHSGILSAVENRLGIQQDFTQWQRSGRAPVGQQTMTGVSADSCQRKAMTDIIESADDCHRKRGQPSSFFRRAKDSIKDKSKTYKERHPNEIGDQQHRRKPQGGGREYSSAGAAKPIPGKYDGLS